MSKTKNNNGSNSNHQQTTQHDTAKTATSIKTEQKGENTNKNAFPHGFSLLTMLIRPGEMDCDRKDVGVRDEERPRDHRSATSGKGKHK